MKRYKKKKKKLIIVGSGGHSRPVVDTAKLLKFGLYCSKIERYKCSIFEHCYG